MKHLILISFFIYSTFSFAQMRAIGVIYDPDGYTNVRAGKGSNFEIVDKILDNEIFAFYDTESENWLKVALTRVQSEESNSMYDITGYMHRSRITNIENLTPEKKRQLFTLIFEKEKDFYQRVINTTERTSTEYSVRSREMMVYHDYQFVPVLGAFERYICEHKDRDLLDKFLSVLEVEEGSADEMPSFTLGAIFMCHPEWMFQSMKNHIGLMKQLEWGIINKIYGQPEEQSSRIKKKYNDFRVSMGLPKTDFSIYQE